VDGGGAACVAESKPATNHTTTITAVTTIVRKMALAAMYTAISNSDETTKMEVIACLLSMNLPSIAPCRETAVCRNY
jgi:peroxiredoxin family protein